MPRRSRRRPPDRRWRRSPPRCSASSQHAKAYERLTVEAAMSGSRVDAPARRCWRTRSSADCGRRAAAARRAARGQPRATCRGSSPTADASPRAARRRGAGSSRAPRPRRRPRARRRGTRSHEVHGLAQAGGLGDRERHRRRVEPVGVLDRHRQPGQRRLEQVVAAHRLVPASARCPRPRARRRPPRSSGPANASGSIATM